MIIWSYFLLQPSFKSIYCNAQRDIWKRIYRKIGTNVNPIKFEWNWIFYENKQYAALNDTFKYSFGNHLKCKRFLMKYLVINVYA